MELLLQSQIALVLASMGTFGTVSIERVYILVIFIDIDRNCDVLPIEYDLF